MGSRRTRSAPTWFLLFAACAVSSAGAPRIENGQRTRVLLTDTRSGSTLVLQNLSSGSRNEVYREGGDAMVKVVEDEQLQKLLDVLAMRGMFEVAGNVAAPGARAVLAVEQAGRAFVWSRPAATATNLDQVRAFDEGRGYVMAIYNAATAYQTSDLQNADSVREAVERERKRRAQGGQ